MARTSLCRVALAHGPAMILCHPAKMARIRTVKPEFWRHPLMGRLPDDFQLLALSLLTMADDEGYFRAEPALIRGDVQPFRDDLVRIHGGLTELSRIEWIELRQHPIQGVIGHIKKWSDHQVVNRPNKSKLKAYFISDDSVSPHGTFSDGTGNREQGKEQGRGSEKIESPPENLPALNYAIRLIEDLSMTDTIANRIVVEAAVRSLVKAGKSGTSAYEFLLGQAKDALDRGDLIDKFWFEDSKWKSTGRKRHVSDRLRAIQEAN